MLFPPFVPEAKQRLKDYLLHLSKCHLLLPPLSPLGSFLPFVFWWRFVVSSASDQMGVPCLLHMVGAHLHT